MQSSYLTDCHQIVLIGLCKANARIQHDLIIRNPGFLRNRDRLPQVIQHIFHKIIVIHIVTIVHQAACHVVTRDHIRHLRIVFQSPDIVDQIRASLDRSLRYRALISIDRYRNVKLFLDCTDHRNHTSDLLLIRNLRISRARRLSTDINDRCTLFDHLLRMRKRCVQLIKPAAVRKRIRCHI